MKKIFILILFITPPSFILPCTTFFISDGDTKIFGRNYDFQIGRGLLMVNKKNVTKESPKDKNNNSIKWSSQYGSVTFNQFGREYPMGGMNEAGLVVELMWMEGTEYPEPDSRPSLATLLWIQYQLDNSATVQDVIDTDTKVRIGKNGVPLHYLIADRNGNSAVIEFIGGKMVYRTEGNMPFKVLANDFYQDGLNYLSKHKGFGGTNEADDSPMSLNRFVRACKLIKECDFNSGITPMDYSFNILKEISQPGSTQWSIVYDLQKLKVSFRTKESEKIKNLNFQNIDFACSTPVKVFDINSDNIGNISQILSDYSQSQNYDLIKYSYSNVDFLKGIPEESIKAISIYPENFLCVEN
jgi:choloylglycine hydrolase